MKTEGYLIFLAIRISDFGRIGLYYKKQGCLVFMAFLMSCFFKYRWYCFFSKHFLQRMERLKCIESLGANLYFQTKFKATTCNRGVNPLCEVFYPIVNRSRTKLDKKFIH